MITKNLLTCAVAFTVTIPMHALADSLNAKVGAWEMTTTSTSAGMLIPDTELAKMSPEQRAQFEKTMQGMLGKPNTQVTKSCIKPEDLDQNHMFKLDDENHCSRNFTSKSSNKIVYEQSCSAPHASTSSVVIEAKTPESIVADMDIIQSDGGGKVHLNIKARWLRASCAGIEDDE